jgi:hypothetical protein
MMTRPTDEEMAAARYLPSSDGTLRPLASLRPTPTSPPNKRLTCIFGGASVEFRGCDRRVRCLRPRPIAWSMRRIADRWGAIPGSALAPTNRLNKLMNGRDHD